MEWGLGGGGAAGAWRWPPPGHGGLWQLAVPGGPTEAGGREGHLWGLLQPVTCKQGQPDREVGMHRTWAGHQCPGWGPPHVPAPTVPDRGCPKPAHTAFPSQILTHPCSIKWLILVFA